MHKLLTKQESRELLKLNGATELQIISLLNLTVPCEWQGGKAYWRECKVLSALANMQGTETSSYTPLSSDFLLSNGKCCDSGCKNCPF